MKYAIKRLRRSDLTLFDVQLRLQNAGKQKAINLNRDVFVDLLFPMAPLEQIGDLPLRFPCDLRIFGPEGIAFPRTVSRKIIAASGTQKNWRLNGETISADPDAERPDRYDALSENDLALFGFEGVIAPKEIDLLLVSHTNPKDAALFQRLSDILGQRRMCSVSATDLTLAVNDMPLEHPIRELLDLELDEAVREAAQGSTAATELIRGRSIRRSTHLALSRARESAERIGRDGEQLVNDYLQRLYDDGRCQSFFWEAEVNAIHPFDFTMDTPDGDAVQIEVKSTEGAHERSMFFSHAEILNAARNSHLQVWRLSRMEGSRATLRVSDGLNQLANQLLQNLALPDGVSPNGWTVAPGALAWSEPTELSDPVDPEN